MKIEISFWEKLSIHVIALFVIAIFATFIPEYLHGFFGDWMCEGSGNIIAGSYNYEKCNYGDWNFHQPVMHWGWRHWLWCFMCISLFAINSIRIIAFMDKRK